jgi:uncharacterized membrane protein
MLRRLALFCTAVLSLDAVTTAQTLKTPQASRVDFQRDVKPLLQKRCAACHNDEMIASNLSVTSRRSLLERRAVVPGKPQKSLLYKMAKSGLMPPPEGGKLLSTAEVDTIRRWIEQGAPW